MKPETKEWLDKLVPLLVHWLEDGKFKIGIGGGVGRPPSLADMVAFPGSYVIHVEPRVVYIPYYENSDGCSMPSYSTEAEAGKHIGLTCIRVVRFVEDLNWKTT